MYLRTGLILIPLSLLVACGQSDPRDAATVDEADLSILALQGAAPGQNLAQPQPKKPVCEHCSVGLGVAAIPDDDELSMVIDAEYVGDIDGLTFLEYTNTSVNTHTFTQSVVDDLNNSATSETIVMMDVPNVVRGLLIFDIDGTNHYEPVSIY